MAVVVVISELH